MFKPPQREFKKEVIPEGTYVARLYSFIDLGVQDKEWKGETISQHKVRLTFELPTETRMFDGVEKPLVISKEYTFSMHPKSRLRPVVEALLGVTLTDPEAYNFDFEDNINDLLGHECMLSVSHFEGQKGIFAQIDNVVRLMKGATCPPQFNENVFYLMTMGENETFKELPEFIREKIANSKTLEKTDLDEETADKLRELRKSHNSKVEDTDEIPF